MKKNTKSTVIVLVIILILLIVTWAILYLKRNQIFFQVEGVITSSPPTPTSEPTLLSKLDLPIVLENLSRSKQIQIANFAVMPKITLFLYFALPLVITGGLGFFFLRKRHRP